MVSFFTAVSSLVSRNWMVRSHLGLMWVTDVIFLRGGESKTFGPETWRHTIRLKNKRWYLIVIINRQVTRANEDSEEKTPRKEPLASSARAYKSWQPFVRTNDRTTANNSRKTVQHRWESSTKRVPKWTRYLPPTVGGSVEEIGMSLFWDRPNVCSHLASDSLWYNKVD